MSGKSYRERSEFRSFKGSLNKNELDVTRITNLSHEKTTRKQNYNNKQTNKPLETTLTLSSKQMSQEEEIDLPIKTVARLFKTAVFEHEDTRITEKSLTLTSEYIKVFVREAILRANEDRLNPKDPNQIDNAVVQNQPVGEVLDVEHLENIAGLLVLDF